MKKKIIITLETKEIDGKRKQEMTLSSPGLSIFEVMGLLKAAMVQAETYFRRDVAASMDREDEF